MPEKDELANDDYIAKLLAEDAKKSSIRYASAGLSALLPAKSARPGPKPNTRFLSHLVRDVDSHNAALKRKEEFEARSRVESFRKTEREDERRRALDLAHSSRNQDRKGRERRPYGKSEHRRSSISPPRQSKDEDNKHRRNRDEKDYETDHRRKRRRRSSDGGAELEDRYRSTKHEQHSGRLKDQDETHDEDKEIRQTPRDRKERHAERSRSPRDKSHHKQPKKQKFHGSKHDHSPQRRRLDSPSDSDPLEDLINRLPPSHPTSTVRIRGRGAHQPFQSNIDTHFSSTYDPSLDVQPTSDHETDRSDWDMALEALRDRTAWKKKQSERLREAGFNDEEIEKWERSATVSVGDADRDVRDVKWRKKGEGREWDVGKKGTWDDDGDREANIKEDVNGDLVEADRKSSRVVGDRDREKSAAQDGWKRKDSGFLKSFRNALGS